MKSELRELRRAIWVLGAGSGFLCSAAILVYDMIAGFPMRDALIATLMLGIMMFVVGLVRLAQLKKKGIE